MTLNEDFLWENNHDQCPWNDGQRCIGQVSYNQHINDPIYEPCQQETCPIFFWRCRW